MFPLPPFSPQAQAFLGALQDSGMYAFAKGLEIVVGLLMLSNRSVPAAMLAATR